MLAIVSVVNFAFVIPYFTRLWARALSSTQNANLLIMSISAVLLFAGATVVGLSWNAATFLGGN
jgi:hypothetical protein